MCMTTNKFHAAWSPFYGQFGVQKWPFSACFQDHRLESSRQLPVCQVGVFNEDRSSSTLIGLSMIANGDFNEASPTPWCHAVVHFEVKMSRFSVAFLDNRPEF